MPHKKILDDMTRDELLTKCREQSRTISELRAINFHHMVLLCQYMVRFPRSEWDTKKCQTSNQ